MKKRTTAAAQSSTVVHVALFLQLFSPSVHVDPGLSVATIAATILIGLYGVGWEFNQLYGAVGDL